MSENMRRTTSTIVTVVLVAIVAWGLIVGEPAPVDRVEALGSRIKCPVCQGESITESPSGYAVDLLAFVEEKVDDGWTDGEIVTYLEGRFAGIRLDPAFSGTTILLWLLPPVALVGGIVLVSRRTTRSDAPVATGP